MSKYQEALKRLINDDYVEKSGNQYELDIKLIQELVDKATKDEELSAKQMFEELGYVKTNLLKTPSVHYENKKWETAISIFDNEKGRSIHIYALGNTYQDSGFIGIDELKAINQQCKELGWL